SYAENAAPTALLATGAVSDADNPTDFSGGSLTVAINSGAVAGDRISLLGSSPFHIPGGVLQDGANNNIGTISGNGTNSVSITGLTTFATPTVVNQLVESFGFDSTSDNPGTGDRVVRFTFNDGGHTGTPGALSDFVDQTVHVSDSNAAPQVSAPTSYSGSPNVAVTINGITFSDVDDGGGAEVATFTASHGTFSAATVVGVTVGGNNTATLTLTGSVANLDAYLAANNLTYTGTQNDTIGIKIDDQGHTGGGGAQFSTVNVPVTLNTPPTLDLDADNSTAVGNNFQTTFTENGAVVAIA